MAKHMSLAWLMLPGICVAYLFVAAKQEPVKDSSFVSCIINTRKDSVRLYWKDEKGENYRSIQHLQAGLRNSHKKLVFAMNADMYKPDHSPVGLYIENGKILSLLDTANGAGNFYLKPNGIFYIRENNTQFICQTAEFRDDGNIKYAPPIRADVTDRW